MRSLATLGLLVALAPPAAAGGSIVYGTISGNNPGIYLDTRTVGEDENDWKQFRFVISSGSPDGKRLASSSDSQSETDEPTSDYELKGAYCSYLVTDWFGVAPSAVYDKLNFSSWPEDKQLENTKDFLARDYEAKEEAESRGYSSDEMMKEACDTSWTQKRAMVVVRGLHFTERDHAQHGLETGYPVGALVYLSTGTHAIGVRVMSTGEQGMLAVFDPNHGQAYPMARALASTVIGQGKTFLVALPK